MTRLEPCSANISEDGQFDPEHTEESPHEYAGTDIEAFYAAQQVSARESRE